MLHLLHPHVSQLIHLYGVWIVGGIIMAESFGVPLPGETALVSAAVYAGATHAMSLPLLLLVACAGAVIGDNIGYWIGREAGFALLLRYGQRAGLTERRLKLGQYLFRLHGGKIVFFGRFVALLRALAALLAGVNCMPWRHFFLCNVAGAALWVTAYGGGAYILGRRIEHLLGPVALVGLGVAVAGAILGSVLVHRHGKRLEEVAERALPGPLVSPFHRRQAAHRP
ncbi:MAG: DedA family protein [Rhodospirillales bacterium]|nr:DedA family protein [Rhodospirillales bacterium]MDE2198309.1 DedA family protein [Rhodospirillales bacterium]MDE2576305.1 DedA family protein [Rhodospirillales bacterium]